MKVNCITCDLNNHKGRCLYSGYCIDYEGYKNSKPKNSYYFQGEIDYYHLTNDCIADGKLCFLTISPDSATIGISKQISRASLNKILSEFPMPKIRAVDNPFHIFVITRESISWAIELLPEITKVIKKDMKNKAKELYKLKKAGEFSNQPKTKVIVY